MENYYRVIIKRYRMLYGEKANWQPDEAESDFINKVCMLYNYYLPHSSVRFEESPAGAILRYLECSHHYYRYNRLSGIEQTIRLMQEDLEDEHPLLIILSNAFSRFSGELIHHIEEEEKLLFPYIRFLDEINRNPGKLNRLLNYPPLFSLSHFIEHHDESNIEQFARVFYTIEQYKPACTNRSLTRILSDQLNNFRHDLSIHSYLEDKVLMPRFAKIEKQLQTQLHNSLKWN